MTENNEKYKIVTNETRTNIGYEKYQNNDTTTYLYFGLSHRESGPAIIHMRGEKEYYLLGQRNRYNGPACIDKYNNQTIKFWIDGKACHDELYYNKSLLEMFCKCHYCEFEASSFEEASVHWDWEENTGKMISFKIRTIRKYFESGGKE